MDPVLPPEDRRKRRKKKKNTPTCTHTHKTQGEKAPRVSRHDYQSQSLNQQIISRVMSAVHKMETPRSSSACCAMAERGCIRLVPGRMSDGISLRGSSMYAVPRKCHSLPVYISISMKQNTTPPGQ